MHGLKAKITGDGNLGATTMLGRGVRRIRGQRDHGVRCTARRLLPIRIHSRPGVEWLARRSAGGVRRAGAGGTQP